MGRKSAGIARRSLKQSRRRVSKPKTITWLTKELDRVFSQFIRLKYSNKEGVVFCYTCGHFTHYKKIHAGHFISRWYKATRWNENNVRPQCFMCNIYKKGDSVKFRINLIQEIGEKEVEKMEDESARFIKRGAVEKEWMEQKINYYKQQIKLLPAYQASLL